MADATRVARGASMWGALAALTAASIWGGMYVISKYVLLFVPPMTLVWLRLAIAAIVLGGYLALTGRLRISRGELPLLALCGFVGYTLSLGAQFAGTQLSTAHDGALITSATPAFIALFAALLLRERTSPRRWLAIGLATSGVVVVALGQTDAGSAFAPNPLAGNLLLVVAAITWACYTILAKAAVTRHPGRHGALVVTAYATFAGVLFTAPLGAPGLPPVDWAALPLDVWAGMLYLGIISTAVAFYLWNKGFELLDSGLASLFFFAQPVVGSVLGWLLLGEHLPGVFFLGAAAIAGSVLLAARSDS